MSRKIIALFIIMSVLVGGAFTKATQAQEATQSTKQPTLVQKSIADNVCQGVLGTQNTNVDGSTTIDDCRETGNDSFRAVVQRIINIFSIVVGAVSVIMIIIGGFRYIISGGDSSGVSGAKNTILYAIVGLVIVLFSQVLVRFVISNFSTAQTTGNNQQQSQQK